MSKTPEEIAYWRMVLDDDPAPLRYRPSSLRSEAGASTKCDASHRDEEEQQQNQQLQQQNIMNTYTYTYTGYIEFVRRFELTLNGESKPCIEIAMRFDQEKTSGRSLNGIVFCISRPETLENAERLLAEDPNRTRLYQAKVDHKIRPKGAVGEPPAGYFHNGWAWSFAVSA